MGTRHITQVRSGDEIRVSQYGQWDGYPEGQGIVVFNFIKSAERVQALIDNLPNTYVATQEKLQELIKPYLDGSSEGFMSFESGDRWSNDFPSLSRNTGAGILSLIADAKGLVPLSLDLDFINDTLYCEGAYVVDLDAQTFTSYYNREWRDDSERAGEWLSAVTLTFDEARSMSNEDYLAKFAIESVDA